MQKTIAFLLCLFLAFSAAVSLSAEEASAEWPFFSALEQFFSSLNLDEEGIQAALQILGQQYAATMQQDEGITEISLDGLGRCQLTPERVLLDANGMKISLEYASILQELMEAEKQGQQFTTYLNSLLQKALQYLVLPYVKTISSEDGFSLHLSVDNLTFRDNLYQMLMEVIQEDQFIKYYQSIGPYLHQGFPEIPAKAEELADFLEFSVQDNWITSWYGWNIQADLHVNLDGGQVRGVFLDGVFCSQRYGTYPLKFEYALRDTGVLINADLNFPFGGGSLSYADGRISTEMHGRRNKSIFSADGTFDPVTGMVNMTIRMGSDGSTAYVTGYALINELNVSVSYYQDQITVYLVNGQKYIHAKVKSEPYYSYKYTGFDYDFWIHEEPDQEISFKLSGSRMEAGSYRQTVDSYYLILGPTGFTFSIHPNEYTFQRYEGSARYDVTGEGNIDCRLSLLWNDGLSYNQTPYMIHLTGGERNYEVEFSYPYSDWKVEGNGVLRFDRNHMLQSATGNAVTSYYFDPTRAKSKANLIYNPGKLIITYDQGIYCLEKKTDNPTELLYQLTHNATLLGQLKMNLIAAEKGTGCPAVVTQEESPIFGLEIVPVEKEPIIPIDLTNAMVLDLDSILMLMMQQ